MNYQLYTGAYTDGQPGEGVAFWAFDGSVLTEVRRVAGLRNPSYVLPKGKRLYAVEELPDRAGVACLSWEEGDAPQLIWHRGVPGAGLCHLTLSGSVLYASGYDGGTLTGVEAASGEPCYFQEFHGHGPNAARQEKAHIHSCQESPDGSRLLVADLGTDRMYQFLLQEEGKLVPDGEQPWIQTGPGQGPRHFAFHPNGKWMYLVTELDSSLLMYRYENHRLEQVGEYSLLEAGDPEESLAADIHLTADGRFLYVSVRGADCLYCFQVEEDGASLKQLGRFSTEGSWPRNFSLSPDGKFVAVANQQAGSLVIFSRDETTGLLGEVRCQVQVPQISCVKWGT